MSREKRGGWGVVFLLRSSGKGEDVYPEARKAYTKGGNFQVGIEFSHGEKRNLSQNENKASERVHPGTIPMDLKKGAEKCPDAGCKMTLKAERNKGDKASGSDWHESSQRSEEVHGHYSRRRKNSNFHRMRKTTPHHQGGTCKGRHEME